MSIQSFRDITKRTFRRRRANCTVLDWILRHQRISLLQSLPLFYRKRVCLHTPDLDNDPETQHHVPIYFCLPFTVSTMQHPLTTYTTRLPEREQERERDLFFNKSQAFPYHSHQVFRFISPSDIQSLNLQCGQMH